MADVRGRRGDTGDGANKACVPSNAYEAFATCVVCIVEIADEGDVDIQTRIVVESSRRACRTKRLCTSSQSSPRFVSPADLNSIESPSTEAFTDFHCIYS
jgi:hypothetical protein